MSNSGLYTFEYTEYKNYISYNDGKLVLKKPTYLYWL